MSFPKTYVIVRNPERRPGPVSPGVSHQKRYGQRALSSIVLALSFIVLTGLLAVPATNAITTTTTTFTPDGAAAELVRLLNGERVYHGLPALPVDPFLAWVARDGPVPCPDGQVANGRAKDMALNDYFSHQLRLCPTYDISSAFQAWGYIGSASNATSGQTVGEIVAYNSGYDFNLYPYTFGCDVLYNNCNGSTTSAPSTVGLASAQFMTSQGHRDVVLSTLFDRFACGAWQVPWTDYPGSFTTYYSCLFASGPGTAVAPAPTPTAIPIPIITPTPKPIATSTPSPSATPRPNPWLPVHFGSPVSIGSRSRGHRGSIRFR